MTKISYSPQSKIISIKLKSGTSVDSDVSNNVVVDYNKQGEPVNIDIMNIDIHEFQKQRIPVEQFFRVHEKSK